MRPHRVVVLDVLTKHPPQMPFVDGDDVLEALARGISALGRGEFAPPNVSLEPAHNRVSVRAFQP